MSANIWPQKDFYINIHSVIIRTAKIYTQLKCPPIEDEQKNEMFYASQTGIFGNKINADMYVL